MSPPRKKEKKEDAARIAPKVLHSHSIRLELDMTPKCVNAFVQTSDWVEVGGVPWRAKLRRKRHESVYKRRDNNDEHLVVSLHSRDNCSPLWSVDVDAQLELINTDSSKNIVQEQSHTYCRKSNKFEVFIISLPDLQDKKKGYSKDNKIEVIVNFSITSIKGLFRSSPPELDFTDPNDPRHDVALVIDGEKIYTNKGILAAHSHVFNAMFFGGFNEKDKKEVVLKDVNRKEFLEMLRVIYPSHKKITDESVEFLLKLGDQFDINVLVDFAENYLITSSNLKNEHKLLLSDQYRLTNLQHTSLHRMKMTVKFSEEFKASAEYNELSEDFKKALDN